MCDARPDFDTEESLERIYYYVLLYATMLLKKNKH